jgi:hypothetical protein
VFDHALAEGDELCGVEVGTGASERLHSTPTLKILHGKKVFQCSRVATAVWIAVRFTGEGEDE